MTAPTVPVPQAEKPATVKPDFARIDAYFRQRKQWAVWRWEYRIDAKTGQKKLTKPPRQVSGKLAKSNDPSTWTDYETARKAYLAGGLDGVGYFLANDEMMLDIDGCLKNGVLEEWAKPFLASIPSYADRSPGTGAHVLTRSQFSPPDGKKQYNFADADHHGYAFYVPHRFACMTGQRLNNYGVTDCTEQVAKLHAKYFSTNSTAAETQKKATGERNEKTTQLVLEELTEDDQKLIAKARSAKNGQKFSKLWDDQWRPGYSNDDSRADEALMCQLAFWSKKDAVRMERLFSHSALGKREKWTARSDYRWRTVKFALQHQKEVYTAKADDEEEQNDTSGHTIEIDLKALPQTLATLNLCPLFNNAGLKFAWVRRRGSMIQAGFGNPPRQVIWRNARELANFTLAQSAIFDGTGVLLPSPGPRKVRRIWEPLAQLIRSIADQDAVDMEPPLADEFRQILRDVWQKSGKPNADASPDADAPPSPKQVRRQFNLMLHQCQLQNRESSTPACVWIAEGEIWVYPDTLTAWLSTAAGKSKHYSVEQVREGLSLLEFKPVDLHRSLSYCPLHRPAIKTEKPVAPCDIRIRMWHGPLDLLVDDETGEIDELDRDE
jgi:hypothetical protein